MINSLKSFLIAILATSIIGCTTTVMDHTELLDNIQTDLLGDMPLPKGSKINNDKSLILGAGTSWAGRIVINTPQGPTDTFTFFRDQYPNIGWTGVSSIKAKISILVFAKQDRTVTVEITDAGALEDGSVTTLTVAPKGGVFPAAQPPEKLRR